MLGVSVPSRLVLIPCKTVRENIFFNHDWLSIGDSLWIRNRELCPLLSVLGPHLELTDAGRIHGAMLSEFICELVLRLKGLVSLCPPSLMLFQSYLFFFEVPWALKEGFDGAIPFQTECFKVLHSLHIVCLQASVFVLNYCMRKLLWWWLSKALFYEYSRTSLGVI